MSDEWKADWLKKIAAFLWRPPHTVLLSNEDQIREEARALLQTALDSQAAVDEGLLDQAHRWAAGLDVPCFIEGTVDFSTSPMLTHPLNGYEEELDGRAIPSEGTEVKNVIEELRNIDGGDLKKRFLALWRLLPERLRQQNPLWELLPADARVPDYPIWGQASLAAALAGAGEKPAFLFFTIASTQDFIVQARRTQDLWMGSFLFSYLNWRAIQSIIDKAGPDVILSPSLYGQPLVDRWLYHQIGLKDVLLERSAQDLERLKIANISNVFTALVPYKQAEDLAKEAEEALHEAKRAIAEAVRFYVEKALRQEDHLPHLIQKATDKILKKKRQEQIRQHLQQRLPHLKEDEDWEGIWKRQIKEFLRPNIFWVVYPWKSDQASTPDQILERFEAHIRPEEFDFKPILDEIKKHCKDEAQSNLGLAYPLLSRLARQALTARKNLRHFAQVEEPDHKCTQCGVREALHPQWADSTKDPYPELVAFWETLSRVGEWEGAEYKLAGRIRRGDRLCAVCLTKRLAWEAFFLKEPARQGGFADIKKRLELDGRLPAHLLFPSTATIATAKFKEQVLLQLQKGDKDLWKKLQDYVRKTKSMLDSAHILFPSPEIPRLERLADQVSQEPGLDRGLLNNFLRLDGDWLYLESFDPEGIQHEYGLSQPPANLAEAREALEALLSETRRDIPKPRRYFAVLAMDGDSIGKWLAGRRGPRLSDVLHPEMRAPTANKVDREVLNKRRPLGPVLHHALSTALKNYALEIVRPLIEKAHCGRLIYAGGDDIVALLCVEDLFSAMRQLRRLFGSTQEIGDDEQLREKGFIARGCCGFIRLGDGAGGKERWLLLPGDSPTSDETARLTLSAGAVIAHHTHPFSHVVEEVHERALIEDAKDRQGRDAFAIHLLKRSGEPVEVGAKWVCDEVDILETLEEVVSWIRAENLSSKLMYQMKEESPGLSVEVNPAAQEPQVWNLEQLREARLSELTRLVGRHIKAKDKAEREALQKQVKQVLTGLLQSMEKQIKKEIERSEETKKLEKQQWRLWDQVTDLLLVARFVAQEM